jgi:lysophospholipase L1-like esterase
VAGGVLVLLTLAFVVSAFLGNQAPPVPPPAPTDTPIPTATLAPPDTPAPSPTRTVPPLDTPLPTDTPRPTATEVAAPAVSPTGAEGGTAGADAGTPAAGPAAYLTPLRRPIVYSALGASDTVGVGAANPATDAWPAVLAARMPGDTRFMRFARGGIVLSQALNEELPKAIAAKPTLVTIWMAANDFTHKVPLTTYQQNLNTLLARLTGETNAQIVLLNLPDLSLVLAPNRIPGGDPAALRVEVQNWNRVIGVTAAPYGDRVLLVDLFPGTARINAEPGLVSGDDWHPSTAGYKAIADLVYETMLGAGLLPAR